MAKTAKDKTAIQIAADKARAAYKHAKGADDKKTTAQTVKALDDAKAARDKAIEAESAERFRLLATARTKKARIAMKQILNCFRPGYVYTPEQAEQVVRGLQESVDAVKSAANATGKRGKEGDNFAIS